MPSYDAQQVNGCSAGLRAVILNDLDMGADLLLIDLIRVSAFSGMSASLGTKLRGDL